MTILRLRELVQHDFEAVNALIKSKIQIHTGLIDDLSNHIIGSGGKRLRPLIVLAASRACHYSGEQHIMLAAMIEFIHTATLLHDDVIDESKMRRGRETANEIWGDKVSILVGDYLLTQYMQMMTTIGDLTIMQLFTDTVYQMSCGEIKQLENRHKYTLSESDYFEVIRCKTSLLFATSACLGALISKSSETIVNGLYNYGLHLGNAFQLKDDVLDYCADSSTTIGKNIGDDLANGNPTLPLIYALKHASPQQQEQIKQSIGNGTLENLPDILQTIQETNAIEYTNKIAATEVDNAIAALHVLPDSAYKTSLIDLAHYALSRAS
jgi:octaprenyl-diphosphate synthase